ncbi:hypothetical protein F5J12DRAFT_784618 [Pisolithus orientalis]|uniref:uncharacterized protein n=1 Tax=Pisolithus orientalis TaxID=936130 RepID=UPI00222487C7|nr:uncharacterized protein F5J12DRAFT_784618 [Pisolithus orientalis]KAI5999855.1 hypothetical protein F5J12DRAFT_784618 [Pisolithus orientalis]
MPPHRNYQQSKELSTKQPCKHCTEIAKEAVAAMSVLLVHPGITGSLGSAAAVIPVPLRQLSVGPSQSIPGSPTGFALNEDDVLMGMMSPHGRNIPDSAQVAGHSVNSAVPDVQNDHRPEFKTEFHPCSKYPMLFQSAKEFGQQNLKYMAPDCEPWCPFASEGDYIFATVAVEAGLSSTQQGTASVTLHNDAGLCTTLDRVVAQLTPSWLPTHVENAVPFAFILYTDKTWLSSHGTVKGYPMVAHCTNLPVHICNGEQYGGGCMVGWLPIVPELVSEERKTSYVNFKCVVWHKAFYKLLEKVAELSKVGYLHECYDNIHWWLFPVILILSADYEELCVMMLIQGTKCKFPCPFCLVPFEELWDLSKTYKMCTTKQHQEVLVLYEQKKSAGKKKLKSLGLHPVKNAFWLVEHSEPEQAASFKPLHSLHGSLGGNHMHEELKIVVNELGCDFETCLEECYLQLETLIGLDVHTEATLGMIEHELLVFRGELKDNWNFPKAHLWKHVTHDIWSKGAICNYSAQPNEKMHGNKCITHFTDDSNRNDDEDNDKPFEGNTRLSAPQQPSSLSDIENTHWDDWAFEGFCWRLEIFLNACLSTYGYPLNAWIQLQGTDTVWEYQYLQRWTQTWCQAPVAAKQDSSSDSDQMSAKTQGNTLGSEQSDPDVGGPVSE